MALFKIFKGQSENLGIRMPNANEGFAYFTPDDGKFYIDITGNGTEASAAEVGVNRIPLNAALADKVTTTIGETKFEVGLPDDVTEGDTLVVSSQLKGLKANNYINFCNKIFYGGES